MAFTFFFRDIHILDLIMKHVVPFISGRIHARVWDAGCAMGPEPYSLAMLFAENMGHFAFRNLRIYATDLDTCDTFEKIIVEGIYHGEDLKRMPGNFFEKYFRTDGKPGYFKIDDSIREHVIFQKHDLLSLKPVGEDFSLIICKNVLLHFRHEERIEVIRMFHRSLAPGGFFATEQTQKIPNEITHLFEQVSADGQLFRKGEIRS